MLKKIVPILPQIIASLFLTGFMVFAWTEPGSAPPGGNVAAPLNVGNIGQSKEGGLILGTNCVGECTNGLIIDKGNFKINNNGQILGLRAENVSSLPPAGNPGRMVFNATDKKLYYDDGINWKTAGGSVAFVGPLGAGIVQVPNDASQVMCLLSKPPWTGSANLPQNQQYGIYYQGSLVATTYPQIHDGCTDCVKFWNSDINGGGVIEGKRYISECRKRGWWGWCTQWFQGWEDAGVASCYYTKLEA